MSAREIVRMVAVALEAERESYLEWLQNEDYAQIEDKLLEFFTAD